MHAYWWPLLLGVCCGTALSLLRHSLRRRFPVQPFWYELVTHAVALALLLGLLYGAALVWR